MDIGRAFAFVFDDPSWVKKVLIGGLITLAGVIIPLIPSFILYGYMLEIMRRVYLGQTDALPEWNDIGGYLARGFFLTVALFVWLLPAILLTGCAVGAIIVASGSSGDDAVAGVSGLLAFCLFGALILVIMVWAVAFMPIVAGRYAVERRFGAMFAFGEIFAEVRRAGVGALLLLLLTVIIAGFIGNLGIIACLIGLFFTSFYSNLVIAHGAGQVYRRARGMLAGETVPAHPAF
jgi:hypothetical protein